MKKNRIVFGLLLSGILCLPALAQEQAALDVVTPKESPSVNLNPPKPQQPDVRGLYIGWQAGKTGDPIGTTVKFDARFSKYVSGGFRFGRNWKNDVSQNIADEGLIGKAAVAQTTKAANLTGYLPAFRHGTIQPFISGDFGVIDSRTRYDYKGMIQLDPTDSPVAVYGIDIEHFHKFYLPVTAGLQFRKGNWVVSVGGGALIKGYLENSFSDRFQVVFGVQRQLHTLLGIKSLFGR